jgi:hypothetical protein
MGHGMAVGTVRCGTGTVVGVGSVGIKMDWYLLYVRRKCGSCAVEEA